VGILAAWHYFACVLVNQLRVGAGLYWNVDQPRRFVPPGRLDGIIKPFFSGYVIVTMAVQVGLRTNGLGTQGRFGAADDQTRWWAASVAVMRAISFVTAPVVGAGCIDGHRPPRKKRGALARKRRSFRTTGPRVFDKVSLG